MMLAKFVTVLIFIALLIVSCAPKVSDEEIFSQLENLSDEEFDAVMAEDNAALAGKALAYRFSKESSNTIRVVRRQVKALTWLSCSSTANGVNVEYSYERVDSRAFTNSCSGDQLKEYFCAGNRHAQKMIACENGCMGGKCLAALSKFTPVTNGLVGWWDGDDVSGYYANDLQDNFDGTMTSGVATTSEGFIGDAFEFSGNSGSVYVSNFNNGQPLETFTIDAWVKVPPNTLPAGLSAPSPLSAPSDHLAVASQIEAPYAWEFVIAPITGGGVPHLRYEELGVARRVWQADPIKNGQGKQLGNDVWHHVALSFDISLAKNNPQVTPVFYVDGEQVNIKHDQTEFESETASYFHGLHIGNSLMNLFALNHPGNKYWKGKIDEVHIYNRVLTSAEIWSIYNYQPLPALKPEAVQIAVIQK